ncbi:DUF192 domain-containing protein [Alsobacter sp. SYSU M60028]|uniref:DUF192 domain-containing protein n=1 Tax=Alsobacter ponti TaxID=2962936 RepID=A0ABT1LEH2_9HYPH|nr:DUF192 domain-containing protein [Alsobacter ponti]MCP8939902.1 DUF192 domain-containing protein [Alsobacter ponti]
MSNTSLRHRFAVHRFLAAVLSLALGLLPLIWAGGARAEAALEKLVIVTAQGPKTFEVEVMRTDEERARGLMFRRYLPPDRGMLFDFKDVQTAMMWMKDTFIPLDMVFIRKDGTIARIAENTEPHSTRTISSGEPVLGVLELNGGQAAKDGIKPGDRVQHALFGTAK